PRLQPVNPRINTEIGVVAAQLNRPIIFGLGGAIEVQDAVAPLETTLQLQLSSLPGELPSDVSDGTAAGGDVADFEGGLKLRVLHCPLAMEVKLHVPLQGWGRWGGLLVEQQQPDVGQRQVAGMEFRRKGLLRWIEPRLTFDLGAAAEHTYTLNVPHRLFDVKFRCQRVEGLTVELSLLHVDGARSSEVGSRPRQVEMTGG